MSKVARLKTHFRENKDRYTVGAICLGVGAAAACLLRKGDTQIISAEVANVAGRDVNTTYKTVINQEPQRLSYLVKVGEKIYETQREAAEALGVSESNLSRFFNGKTELGLDEVPVRLGVRT